MRLKFAIVLCVILSLLCACGQPNSDIPSEDGIYSENESYKMYIEDGKWYIEFLEPSDTENNSEKETNDYSEVISYPFFDSAADMKEMLTREELPDSMILQLKAMLDGRERLELCDPNKICELSMPTGVAYDCVVLEGKVCSFMVDGQGSIGVIWAVDKETYDEALEREYLEFLDKDPTITNKTTEEDRNAQVVFSKNSSTELKHILYKITAGESEIYVIERYILRRFDSKKEDSRYSYVSETIPVRIGIFGNDGTNYWYGWFRGFEERPSVEWLSSFGLEPLE